MAVEKKVTKSESQVKKEKVVKATNPQKVDVAKKKVKVKKVLKSVVLVSVDGRTLEAYVGTTPYVGKRVVVSGEMKEEIQRLLKEGGFFFKTVKHVPKEDTESDE